ncbi:Selenide, water dikinase [Campylobacter suis]|uniref:Selenide, water dikinase n=1 Tax=Campylobacter suis TaxID=2790657 RepID=A0ABM8Q0F9_9BACT|nr:Selenide, water dikinase [Campylobacter suis]
MLSSTTSNEDASVFRLSDDLALVQTLDFITPVVNDPFIYGQIAAANSLSDIFAMGASVINALNIVGFDSCNLESEILSEIMAGGASKVKECGGVVVGGHSIATPEMYYGLSVTGAIHPNKFWANNTAKVGDLLILTKPLGTGVLSTAIKGDMLNLDQIKEAAFYMSQLNFYAVGAMSEIFVHAATDITGFGFLGHLFEMGRDDIAFEIFTQNVPILQSAKEMADIGLLPEGSYKNRDFASAYVDGKADMLLYDAQTSGGLLLAISQKDAQLALNRLKDVGYTQSAIVGEVFERKPTQKLINLS